MKIKTQLTLAALMAMGLFASGCSQQSADASVSPAQQTTSQQTTSQQTTSQQTSQQAANEVVDEGEKVIVDETTGGGTVVKEVVRTVVDCSKCGKRPSGRPTGGKWTHSHPAIPGCTNSITHSHPFTVRNHKHSYSCKKMGGGGKKVVKRPVRHGGGGGGAKRPRPMGNKWLHTHPAIPGCTNSVTHAHPYANRNHTHAYGCRKAGGKGRPGRPGVRKPGRVVRPNPPRRPPMVRPVPRPLPPVQPPVVVVPPTKAKGIYKGPIGYNPATLKMMSDYQKAQ